MNDDADTWFEDTWNYRDTVAYPELIGATSDGRISTIPYVAFEQIGAVQVDPRWLHCGVLAFRPPSPTAAFTFVTSGLSNAWDDARPDERSISGLGIELRVDVSREAHWTTDVLLRISAMQLLIGSGRMSGARLLGVGDRMKVGAETFGKNSSVTSLIAADGGQIQLPSGTFTLLQLFAITDAEREHAASHGADALLTILRARTAFPISDVTRASVV
jgi:hypothetical protein